jgi:hypothetical protein
VHYQLCVATAVFCERVGQSPEIMQDLEKSTRADVRHTSDESCEELPSQRKFFAIVYSCAFLLSLSNGFLSAKISFITVDWFAGATCAGVNTANCDDSIPLSCACKAAVTTYAWASGVNTFTSLGFALFIVPFLTRASDAFGRRIFIQVLSHSALALCFEAHELLLYLPAKPFAHAAFLR